MSLLRAIHSDKRALYRSGFRRDWPVCSYVFVGWLGSGRRAVRLAITPAHHSRFSEAVVAQPTGVGTGTSGRVLGPFLVPDVNWPDRILGGIFGFLALEVIRQAFRKLRQVEGMGGGDPKLFGAIGLWIGWQGLPMTLLLATLIGFICIAVAFALSKKSDTQLPFGAYMGMAAFAIVLLA